MAMTINTNVVSLNAQRNLSLSGGSLSTTMQRLSSGLRVNSAKDDAAGLAIAERMAANTKGLAVASRNTNDGISLAQTAEGALGKVGDMLQRMRELAVQSSNATNSTDDRKALQAEVSQLTAEIDRVAKTTSFNGKNLLDGSFGGAVFQIGSNAGDNITVGGITNAKTSDIGSVSYGERKFDGTTAAGAGTGIDNGTFKLAAAAGEAYGYTQKIEQGVLKVNGVALDEISAASSGSERMGQVVAAINAKTADTGVTAFLEETAQGSGKFNVRLMSEKLNADGSVADVKLTGFHTKLTGIGRANEAAIAAPADAAAANTALANLGKAAGAASEFVAIRGSGTVTAGVSAGNDDSASLTTAAAIANEKGLASMKVTTQADAWKAIKKIDEAIDQVNSARGDLGALQTRFEKTVENIDIQNENISAAKGRIVDADFATETANLSRAQILQQAGTAMVAQANQLPQSVLSLLR